MMTSATTGFNPEKSLTRIELPLSQLPSKGSNSALEPALRALSGVSEVKVNEAAGRLEVSYDPERGLFPFFGLLLSSLIASTATAFSSVMVVGNANRLRGFRPTFVR